MCAAGITLSPKQIQRGTQLAQQQGLSNVQFQRMDALQMDFPDNSFDLVWACESGEHMPDKKKYIEEMTRVLKPGNRLLLQGCLHHLQCQLRATRLFSLSSFVVACRASIPECRCLLHS